MPCQVIVAASCSVTSHSGRGHRSSGRSGHVGALVTKSVACTDKCLCCALCVLVPFFAFGHVQRSAHVGFVHPCTPALLGCLWMPVPRPCSPRHVHRVSAL